MHDGITGKKKNSLAMFKEKIERTVDEKKSKCRQAQIDGDRSSTQFGSAVSWESEKARNENFRFLLYFECKIPL